MLPIHPACAAYPRISASELASLAEDIKVHGLQVPIMMIRENGKDLLLDGISRLDAIEANGIDLINERGEFDITLGFGCGSRIHTITGGDPYELAASLNAHRRHLTLEQKRERIEAARYWVCASCALVAIQEVPVVIGFAPVGFYRRQNGTGAV